MSKAHYKIRKDKDAQPPRSGRSFGQLVPLKDMDVGDSFTFPNVDAKRVESRIEQYGKTNGATFMVNIGDEQFDYDSFKNSYDTNPMIQQLVQRFDARGVELKTRTKNPKKAQPGGEGEVAKMAKAATNRRQGWQYFIFIVLYKNDLIKSKVWLC